MIGVIEAVYLSTVILFIVALERMGHPRSSYSGIAWAGIAMSLSVAVTFLLPGISNLWLIFVGIASGGSLGWFAARKVSMANMPQMVAVYNGMGAGAAAAIASVELIGGNLFNAATSFAMAGTILGSLSLSGSLVAFAKLQGLMGRRLLVFRGQQIVNTAILVTGVGFAFLFFLVHNETYGGFVLALVIAFSLAYGFTMALPIGGADMPVIIALFNSFTGIAVALDGYSISNYAMIVAGILVGTSGIILTSAMARAMNRNLAEVIFKPFGKGAEPVSGDARRIRAIGAEDAAILLSFSDKVIIIPGFGMASAQAQFLVKDLMEALESRGVKVLFAVHPVAGRMPGHMNVLLAEAGVPYELLLDLDVANRELESAGVALVVGANDVVNPAADEPGNPLYGMPILRANKAREVVVLKRGQGKGFSGVENTLFTMKNTSLLYGDAREMVSKILESLKKI